MAARNSGFWLGVGAALLAILGAGAWIFRDELVRIDARLSASPGISVIQFGRGLTPDGSQVLDPADRFGPGDTVAWVARFENGIGTRELNVALFKIVDGTEMQLDRNIMKIEDPSWKVIYNYSQAGAFLAFLPGNTEERHTFRIKYRTAERVLAQGDFTILKSPGASAAQKPGEQPPAPAIQ